jgi:hypothetical protein
MCLPSKKIGWGCSSELSGSPETKIGMANLVYNIKRLIFLRNLAIDDRLYYGRRPMRLIPNYDQGKSIAGVRKSPSR